MIRQVSRSEVVIPAHCKESQKEHYVNRFLAATKGTGNLVLFAGDQRIEHLHADFQGEGIDSSDANPMHLFRIASESDVGVFAAHHGLISRYASLFPSVRYLVKMNAKTNLVSEKQKEPVSRSLVDFSDVLALRDSGVDVVGVGYTLYIGSEFEAEMLAEAGRLISSAHREGLLVVLWLYPRGKAVDNPRSPYLAASAAGVAACLGADFVKVSAPKDAEHGALDPMLLSDAVVAGGLTGVLPSGGSSVSPNDFLARVFSQVHDAGCRGCAVGRNIHQKSLSEAVSMVRALHAVVTDGAELSYAQSLIK